MKARMRILFGVLWVGAMALSACGPPQGSPGAAIGAEVGWRALATPQPLSDQAGARLMVADLAQPGNGGMGPGAMGPIEPVVVAAVAMALPAAAVPMPMPMTVALVPPGTTMKALAAVTLLGTPGVPPTALREYPAGSIFTIIGNSDGGETGAYVNDVLWSHVRAPDGQTGWLRDADLQFVAETGQSQPTPCAGCTGCGLNCTSPRPHTCTGCVPPCGSVPCAGCPPPCGPGTVIVPPP